MKGKPIGWGRLRAQRDAAARFPILAGAALLLVAAAVPAAAQDPYSGAGEREGQGEVQVGAGTTTQVTTGTSGTRPEATPTEAEIPPPPDASLCETIREANVRQNCIDKVAE